MRTRRSERGFSLVELMTVIVIFAVLAAIAMPVMSRWVPRKRMNAAARDIASSMAQAKAEAIRRGARVAVAFPAPVEDSAYDANAPLYRIFVDDKTPNGQLDAGEETVMTGTALPSRVEPRKNGAQSDLEWLTNNALVFDNRGMPASAAGGAGHGFVRVCVKESGNTCRSVEVSAAGRISVKVD